MQYSEVSIATTHEGVEILSSALYEAGVNGLSIEDPSDLEEFMRTSTGWDYIDEELLRNKNGQVFVKAYVCQNPQGAELLAAIKSAVESLRSANLEVDIGSLEMGFLDVSEEDWANNWKQYYKPFEVGEGIIIKPQWENIENSEGKTIIELNPGMAFGTGMHQSTQLCLCALEKAAPGCRRLLDLGCGSGILAISALLMGTDEAVGIDIDEGAVKIALENAALNRLGPPRFTALAGNLLENEALASSLGHFDVVVENIVADVIIELAPVSKALLKPAGVLITSGIIEERLNDVVCALCANGFSLIGTDARQGWASAVFSA